MYSKLLWLFHKLTKSLPVPNLLKQFNLTGMEGTFDCKLHMFTSSYTCQRIRWQKKKSKLFSIRQKNQNKPSDTGQMGKVELQGKHRRQKPLTYIFCLTSATTQVFLNFAKFLSLLNLLGNCCISQFIYVTKINTNIVFVEV